MDTSELRIGNWISFKGLWKGQVSQIGTSHILIKDNGGFFDEEPFEPIPVTIKILEDLGAEKFGDGESLTLNNRLIGFAECRNEYYDKSTSITLTSLHQFQNLHYILTGKEICHENFKP